MIRIIIGIIFIIGGFSGNLVLVGTNSGMALAVVGFILVGISIYQFASGGGNSVDNAPIAREEMCVVRDEKLIIYNKSHESLGVLTELDVNESVIIDFGTDFDRFYKARTPQGSVGYVLKTAKYTRLSS